LLAGHLKADSMAVMIEPATSSVRGIGPRRRAGSALHLASPIVFDEIHYRFRPYHALGAYAQSKTATCCSPSRPAAWAADGVTVNEALVGMTRFASAPPKTVGQGAATSVLLAASPLVKGVGGRYFEDCHEAEVVKLWEVTEAMLRASRG
jgi:hypothetical protein